MSAEESVKFMQINAEYDAFLGRMALKGVEGAPPYEIKGKDGEYIEVRFDKTGLTTDDTLKEDANFKKLQKAWEDKVGEWKKAAKGLGWDEPTSFNDSGMPNTPELVRK